MNREKTLRKSEAFKTKKSFRTPRTNSWVFAVVLKVPRWRSGKDEVSSSQGGQRKRVQVTETLSNQKLELFLEKVGVS